MNCVRQLPEALDGQNDDLAYEIGVSTVTIPKKLHIPDVRLEGRNFRTDDRFVRGLGVRWPLFTSALLLVAMLFAVGAGARGSPVLHNFGGADGAHPGSSVVIAGNSLYGTTPDGGDYGAGTIFKLNRDGSGFSVLHNFNQSDGASPLGLTLYSTTLFGATIFGGAFNYGVVFRMEVDGSQYQVLHSFNLNDGAFPSSSLVLSGTRLYGTARAGGSSGSAGTVFTLSWEGEAYRVLYSFGAPGSGDGYSPQGQLVLNGTTLIGSTAGGGSQWSGTIFKLETDGSGYQRVWSHASSAGLTMVNGLIYGVMDGNLFQVQPDGTGATTIPIAGGLPGTASSISGFGGQLYGSVSSEVFTLKPDGSGYTLLKPFDGYDGTNLTGPLLVSDAWLYGTTSDGGLAADGTVSTNGTVFRLLLDSGPPDVTLPPQDQAVELGDKAVFEIGVGNLEPCGYQWVFNGSQVLGGATGPILQLTNVQANQSGNYAVVVTNSFGAITSTAAQLYVILPGTTPVAFATPGALHAALAGPGPVTFACDGEIIIPNTLTIASDILLDGSGHRITISGGRWVPVFRVNSNVTFSAANVTIADGAAISGGGIYNDGGTVNLTNCTLVANRAVAPDQPFGSSVGTDGCGGAIFNAGTLNVSRCKFDDNTAEGGGGGQAPPPTYSSPGYGLSGGQGEGGAIANFGGMVVDQSQFQDNTVVGGAGGPGGPGGPTDPSFTWAYPGGSGGSGGMGAGAAIGNFGRMLLNRSSFAGNRGVGGVGGYGGAGYGVRGVGPLLVSAGGAGGPGGDASGSAVYNAGSGVVINCTLANNQGLGGGGGSGGGGGWASDHGYVVHAPDGPPGGPGGAFAALHSAAGTLRATNCTLAYNSGGVCGGTSGTNTTLMNTLVAGNAPRNADGASIDAGHNLGSDLSCGFTNVGSLTVTDARIGPLSDNGGPTPTVALLSDSPAIAAADSGAAPELDQRGYPRPTGSADIGAYEFGYPPIIKKLGLIGGGVSIETWGRPGQVCRLLASPDLKRWIPVATNMFNSQQTAVFETDLAPGPSRHFYRVVTP